MRKSMLSLFHQLVLAQLRQVVSRLVRIKSSSLVMMVELVPHHGTQRVMLVYHGKWDLLKRIKL